MWKGLLYYENDHMMNSFYLLNKEAFVINKHILKRLTRNINSDNEENKGTKTVECAERHEKNNVGRKINTIKTIKWICTLN